MNDVKLSPVMQLLRLSEDFSIISKFSFSPVSKALSLLHHLAFMPIAKKVLIYRWFEEVWNKKRESAIEEMLHPDATIYGLGNSPSEVIRGPKGFLPFWQKFVSAFPNINVAVESVLVEEDKVAARCSVRGTHTGQGLGIEPTGTKIQFTGMVMAHVKDDKVFEVWNNFDFLSLYQQLGLVKMNATQ
jgi:predicted ester cyclase